MPRTIGGVVYRHVTSRLVIDSAGNPVEGLTGGVVYANDGTPLAVAEYPSGAAMTTVPTSLLGVTPELYVAFPVGAEPEGYIDWPDDNIPAQAISATAAELTDWMRTAIEAEVAATQAAAEQSAADAAGALAAVSAIQASLTATLANATASAVVTSTGQRVPLYAKNEGEADPPGGYPVGSLVAVRFS